MKRENVSTEPTLDLEVLDLYLHREAMFRRGESSFQQLSTTIMLDDPNLLQVVATHRRLLATREA